MKLLKRLLSFFPPIYFLVFWVRYQWEIKRAKELIIVTTPGHVGSSTVYKTLKTVHWPEGTYVYDIHSLNERFNNSSAVPSISARHVLQEVLRTKARKNQLADKQVTIITVVRDPVARALGGMFQNSDVFIKGVKVNKLEHQDFEKMKEEVYDQFVNGGHLIDTVNWQLRFYKEELKEIWDLDVSLIEGQNGNSILEGNGRTLLLFTLEELSNDLSELLKIKWGVAPQVLIANSNENEFYNYCKKELKFKKDLLQQVYQDPFLSKLYSKEMIERLIQRWQDG